jgi:hypothetical protein
LHLKTKELQDNSGLISVKPCSELQSGIPIQIPDVLSSSTTRVFGSGYFHGIQKLATGLLAFLLYFSVGPGSLYSQSLDLGSNNSGLSIGNSKNWSGLRINLRDSGVQSVAGINLTLWKADQNKEAVETGLSLGLIAPEAGILRGIQTGGLGVAAKSELSGISLGLLGIGSGGRMRGISIGGLGAGAGGDMCGITIGGLGAGSGGNATGIVIAGLGAGAGGNMKGISIGGLGAGAGKNLTGITLSLFGGGSGKDMTGISVSGLGAGAGKNATGLMIGGLGAGAVKNLRGITAALLGAGAGENMTGIVLAGLGAGARERLTGLAIAGLGAGAQEIRGIAVAGFVTGGQNVKGATLTAGWAKISEGGSHTGVTVGAFNQIKGSQTGLAIGIVNYAYALHGIQLGIINHVRDNPKYLRTLPVVNMHFE